VLVARRLSAALVVLLVACTFDGADLRVVLPAEMPSARPGFTSSWAMDVVNDTGSTYELTALSISSNTAAAPVNPFRVELDDLDATFPVVLGAGEGVAVRVFFSPRTLGERSGTLQAVTYLTDVRVGGGACSGGNGREAPQDTLQTVWGDILAVGLADAAFEDCDDGVDNDADGVVDCEDRDCSGDADCVPTEGCAPTGDLACDTAAFASTEARENTFEQYCAIETEEYLAPEEVWSFLPDVTGPVTVTVEAEGWDPTFVLLEGAFEQDGTLLCDPDSCIAIGANEGASETIEFVADAGAGYFFVIDGAEGEAGPYSISVSCGLDSEVDCGDGLDDDGDGDVDCADSDCATAPECLPSGTCEPGVTLSCGDSITAVNAGGGTTRDVDRWCDEPTADHEGTEVAWIFTTDASVEVEVEISDMVADLDVIAMLENPAGGGFCDPDLCISDDPWVRGNGDETIRFDAFAGTRYVLAVDGYQGGSSPFRLTISCQ
jgi:hypothetical protein